MKIIDFLTQYLEGIFETGLGFIQTLIGFVLIRLYYSIPVYLIWTYVIVNIFIVPPISFLACWGILVAFDCIRFDITKLYMPNTNNDEE